MQKIIILLGFSFLFHLSSNAQQQDSHVSNLSPSYWAAVSSQFKHFRNFLGSYQQSVSNYTWTVPPGVSQVMIECWGSGSGSRLDVGGEAGGYGMAIVNILPGTTLEIAIGWGGRGNAGPVNRQGFPTTVAWQVSSQLYFVRAYGGASALSADFQIPSQYSYGRFGNPGEPAMSYFSQKTASVNTIVTHCGAGGAPYGFPFQMGEGSQFTLVEGSNALDTYALAASDGPIPGGGAGGIINSASNTLGAFQNGGPGMVLIRW